MADQYSPAEIAEIFEAYNNAIKTNTPISKELAAQMADAARGVKNYTSELKASSLSFKRSMGDLVGSMKDGAQGAGQYGDALSKGADYLDKWLSPAGPWGKAGMLLVKGATMYVNAVSKQADALYKSYQDISRTGATAAGGITELYTNMQKFGYGIAELGNLAALVQENADSLALLGGTVFEGTKAFSNMSDSIRNSDIGFKFESMGINVDNMNKGIAGYLRIQTITGQQGLKTQEELRAGAEAYILQQDRLTKLTGASANEQQKITEAALSEERFAASQAQLRRRAMEEGNTALAKEADKRQELNKYVTKMYGPEAAKAFRDSTTGYLNSPESQKFLRTFPEARQLIMEGADMSDITASMSRGAAATTRMSEELGKAGQANKIYINNAELYRGQAAKDLAMAEQQADLESDVGDAATKNLTGLARTQRKTRDDLQNLLQVGIRPVTAGMEGLAKVLGTIPGVASAAATSVTGGAGGTGKDQAGGGVGGFFKKIFGKGAAPSDTYMQKMIGAESGGRNIANASGPGGRPTSSAFGIGQMLKGTFEGLVKGAGSSNPLKGKTFEDYKGDIELQKEALKQFTDQNRGILTNAGINVTDASLYLAHFLGPAGAIKALQAGDQTPITSAVGAAAYEANPNLQKMRTVADLKSWASQKMGGAGYQYGGIASGPTSGYQTMLHGTEAVIPLPNGKTIPVEMPGFTASLSDQTGLMTQQLGKLDELLRVMQSQVNVSNKILQRSQ